MLRRAALLLAVVGGVAGPGLVATAPAAAAVWCGSGEPTADLPDAVNAISIHVVYALPSNAADRFAASAADAASDTEAISAWWQGQDSTRTPRFDLFAAPGCPDDLDRVDVTLFRLPYAAGTGSTYDGVVAALQAGGLDSPDKGYLVYVDDKSSTSGDSGQICGQGDSDERALGYAIVYLQSCGLDSNGDRRQLVIAHELVHAMGAVSPDAPHYCNSGHVCDSPDDLMTSVFTSGVTLASRILDVGHDDYYDHPGDWWDVRNSLLLTWLDSTAPDPPALVGLTATSTGPAVDVDWAETAAASRDIHYRIYDANGQLVGDPQIFTSYTTVGTFGETLQWTVRSINDIGLLGPPATIRFKAGYGIVDAAGTLVQDTAAPAAVARLRARRSGKTVVLRWNPVSDPVGLRGYRISIGGLAAKTVTGTSIAFPAAKVLGKSVAAQTVDEAGNRAPAVSLTVRR